MKYLAAPLILIVLVAAWLLSLLGSGFASAEEIARVPSPDARLEAVVIETNGGATTPFGYFVCVVLPGAACDPGAAVATATSAMRSATERGVDPAWTRSDALRIGVHAARRWKLQVPSIDIDGRTVQLAMGPSFASPR